MGLLYWDKPEKIRSSEAHREMHSADGAPPGTWTSAAPRCFPAQLTGFQLFCRDELCRFIDAWAEFLETCNGYDTE